jgi:hypothetical protein
LRFGELEDLIDWDLGPFLEGADQWMTVYTLDFIKSLSSAIGLNYAEVLAGLAIDAPEATISPPQAASEQQ